MNEAAFRKTLLDTLCYDRFLVFIWQMNTKMI